MPRVVSAGVPMRMPDGSSGGRVSKGMPLRLTVMPAASRALLGHLAGQALRGHVHQQQVIVGAAGDEAEAGALQFVGERLGVGDGLGGVGAERRACSASPKAMALAAMTCISGPPCMPGKTA